MVVSSLFRLLFSAWKGVSNATLAQNPLDRSCARCSGGHRGPRRRVRRWWRWRLLTGSTRNLRLGRGERSGSQGQHGGQQLRPSTAYALSGAGSAARAFGSLPGPSRSAESPVTGSQCDARWGGSAARCEVVAGGRAADRPPDQATAAERQWREHVLAAVAANLGLRGGPVVRPPLRETPDPRRHPIPPELIVLRPGSKQAAFRADLRALGREV